MKDLLDVTVVIPVKNEEDNLKRCLPRLSAFKRILVVDSASSDQTCSVAESLGAEVIRFVWDGKFPKKRNWTLRNCRLETEWVLFLDADELVNEEFVEALRGELSSTRCNAFWLTFNNYFEGKLLKHGIPFIKTALLRAGKGEYEQIDETRWSQLDMEIHEHLIVEGESGVIQSAIEHRDIRGLSHYIAKHEEYANWEANRYSKLFDSEGNKIPKIWENLSSRQKKKYNNLVRWWFAPAYFFMSYLVHLGFLDGLPGLRFAFLKFCYFRNIRKKIINNK